MRQEYRPNTATTAYPHRVLFYLGLEELDVEF
jgi:hypothetical protein